MRAFILYLVIICESHLETRGRTSLEHKPKLKRGEWKNERNFGFDDTTEAPLNKLSELPDFTASYYTNIQFPSTKEARMYNGKKIASLTSGTGKMVNHL